MAEKISEFALQAFLEGLREDIYASLCSSTGELISALQEREVNKGRQIAARLNEGLHFCDSDRPRYFLAKIVTLMDCDDVFLHCDELSAWLLALERELDRVRRSHRPLTAASAAVSDFLHDSCSVPVRESLATNKAAKQQGRWPRRERTH